MKELCELAIIKGEQEFKESIVLYFTSKYAKPEYLPEDLENGKVENFPAIKKYLDFLSNPPDELGGEKDNARHLLGACSRMRISAGKSNQTLNLLHGFAWLAFADQKILALEDGKLRKTLEEIKEAIFFFANEVGWRTTMETFLITLIS
jgi:ATP-dependent DNA helicase RecQ